jgi:type I restriction enzyme S subunit
LIARMPDPLGRACIFEGISQKCITVVDVCIIRVDSNIVDARWLMHAINSDSVRRQISSFAKGATRVRISRKNLSHIQIEFPPLAEQQRIAALLDTADRILKQRESAIAKLDQLAQSLFVNIFKNEKDIKKVGDLFSINMNKINVKLKDEDDVAFIPMAAVSEKSKTIVDHQTRKHIDVKKGYTPIANGDLIVAKITPCYENGKMAIAKLNFGDVAYGSTEFHTFRSNDPKLVTYLHYFLMNEQVRISGAKSMKGAAGQRRVPSNFFADLKIASPSTKSLNSFCDAISEIDSIKSKSVIAIEQCKNLIASLQYQSFPVN